MAEQVIRGIHVAGTGGDRLFREQNMVGNGWPEIGDLDALGPDRESFKSAVARTFRHDQEDMLSTLQVSFTDSFTR